MTTQPVRTEVFLVEVTGCEWRREEGKVGSTSDSEMSDRNHGGRPQRRESS